MSNCALAVRIPGGFQLRHRIAIPKATSDGAFILGDRVRVRSFRRHGGTGTYGVVVAINLPLHETRQFKEGPPPRPYQVLLDECPNKLFRFGATDLELVDS